MRLQVAALVALVALELSLGGGAGGLPTAAAQTPAGDTTAAAPSAPPSPVPPTVAAPPDPESPAATVGGGPAATPSGRGGSVGRGPAIVVPDSVSGRQRTPLPVRAHPWLRVPEGDLDALREERLSVVRMGRCLGALCSNRRELEQLESLTDLTAGALVSAELFVRARNNLMATGYFRDVIFELHPQRVGVDVTIQLRGKVFIDRVRIEVAEWFPTVFQREIRQRLVYRPGTALDRDPEVRRRQEETIRRLYERKGFEGTQVNITWRVRGHSAEVLIKISEGRGYRLRTVHVRGASHFTADEVAQVFAGVLNLSGATLWGATLVPALTRELREEREVELVRLYQEAGYFEASVQSRVERIEGEGSIDLLVDIDEGPRYTVRFLGNSTLKDWDLRERLTFWQSRSVTPDDVRRSAAQLREAYMEEGHYFARVRPEVSPDDPTLVRLRIDEGPRASIASIHFKGNDAFEGDDRPLRAVLASGESGLLTTRRLIPEQTEEDRARVVNYYRDQGYLRVQVELPQVYLDPERHTLYRPPTVQEAGDEAGPPEPAPEGGRLVHAPPSEDSVPLYLDIRVYEGQQTRVRALTISGNRFVSDASVVKTLGLRAAAPFSPGRLAKGVAALRQRYIGAGFPNAKIGLRCRSEGLGQSCVQDSVYGARVDVAVEIVEGSRARLGELFVRGNRRTRRQVILDEIPMQPGDLFDRGKLMEGQTRLRSLGLFRAIRITEIGSQPEEPRSRVALVIEVEERENRFVEFNTTLRSVGLEQDESTLLWGVETRFLERNLFGRGLHLSLPFSVGNEKTGLEPGLLWPRPFKQVLPTTWRVFARAENDLRSTVDVVPVSADLGSFFGARSFFDNYNRFRFGTQLKVLVEHWGLRMTPNIGVEREGERQLAEQQLCLTGQGTRSECVDFDNLVRLGLPVLHDRRDNPLHPTRGYSVLVEGNYSRKLVLGETSEAENQYARLMTTMQGYIPLMDSRLVMATMLRLGWVIPLQGLEADIPSEDRFFLGGDGRLRGFAEKSVGLKDRYGVAQGDLVRLLGTAELRVHVTWWFWTALFYDTGMLVHAPGDLDTGQLRHSVGIGLRLLLLELIPLRFDFARVLDPQPQDDMSIFSFNLGYTF